MKIALAQINYHIGNFESNTSRIISAIHEAGEKGAELVVFSELAVSGYPPRDFLEFDDFIHKCLNAIEQIARACINIAAIVGGPSVNPEVKGKNLFNTAFFLADGKVTSMHHKSLLPNYDVFDEYRYFEPASHLQLAEYKGRKIAVTICEDLWNIGDDLLYRSNPMDELFSLGPDLIVNIAASPFHCGHAEQRKTVLMKNVEKYKLPLIYVNHVGAQTELLFDGGSMIFNSSGALVGRMPFFREGLSVFDTANSEKVTVPIDAVLSAPSRIELMHDALVMGIKNYFGKLGFTKAILGLSGGIDSAVTMVLAARALGHKNVKAVLLPSAFSSAHSVADAESLALKLGSPYEIIPIENAYQVFLKDLKPAFENRPFDITEENLQARIRGVILMALSNKFGHILLNTSNKSEAAVGYGTLYGDMNGGLSVLGDVYKTGVYELARFINKDGEVIPVNTLRKPPSAELRPNQKDSDSLPDYEILDKILFRYIEERKGPQELIRMGFDPETVTRVLKLVNTNEYKRYQTPPILRISPKAFGMGRRMPIVAKYLS
ncbi:MAG: NAD+ synthase [Bacteroidales bacterium]|nr:NAD+ synthase [Bacteroidales bacterium]